MTILVTGASGFIGARLAGPGVRLLLRRAGARDASAVVGDLLEPATLSGACDGVDCVFHCAGFAHAFAATNPELHWRVNRDGTRNLADAAGRAGVKRFVFLSSVKAMAEPGDDCVDEDWPGEPDTDYGRAKRAAEAAVLDAGARYGMHVVNLRLAMVYGRGGRGNLERMARAVRAGWFPPLPETGNRRSLVHVQDVVRAMRLVAEIPAASGRTYIIADSRPYSGRDLYDALTDALGKPRARWRAPAWMLRLAGRAGDAATRSARRQFPVSSEIVSRLLDSACYSPARIERELGWRASIGLAEGVREMLGHEAS